MRRRLRRWRLRLRAWWVCRRDRGAHPVAELIARGEWSALDRLLAETPDADDRGRTRLWIDRCFAIRGSGTVVTGTGPHSGDEDASDRLPFDLETVSQVHADLVFLVVGLTVGLLVAAGPSVSRFGAGVVAAVAALAVLPLRSRLQSGVDRMLHGDRRDPFGAVSRLADSAHRAPTLAGTLEGVATSVATSLRVPDRTDATARSFWAIPAETSSGSGPELPMQVVHP